MDNTAYISNFMARLRTNDQLFSNFVAAVGAGNNKLFQSSRKESLILDDTWIFTIEGVLFSIEKITRDPRKFIKELENIVDVERAKKTSSKTMRHLASHSANVRKIDENGDVVARRVLTTELEEDVAIYENRFIGTLVHRLATFLEVRSNDINAHFKAYDETDLRVKSEFKYGVSNIAYEMKVMVRQPPVTEEYQDKLGELMGKIADMKKRIRVLLSTPFMKAMDKVKPVHAPIQKTNLIRMQQDYRNAYQLWLYISAYTSQGFSVEVTDKTMPIDGDYFDDLTVLTALSVKSMIANNLLKQEVYDSIPFNAPEVKKFKNLSKVDFESEFKTDKDAGDVDDSINEYYFQQMKQSFAKEAKAEETAEAENPDEERKPEDKERTLKASFARFYNTVTKVNNEMFLDLINKQSPREMGRTVLEKKKAVLAQQEVLAVRLKQLNVLKMKELEKSQKQESSAFSKIEQQKASIAKEIEREEKARIAVEKAKEKARLEKEKAKDKARLAKERARLASEKKRRLEAERKENTRIRAIKEKENLAKKRAEEQEAKRIANIMRQQNQLDKKKSQIEARIKAENEKVEQAKRRKTEAEKSRKLDAKVADAKKSLTKVKCSQRAQETEGDLPVDD